MSVFFDNAATTEIYALSLHDALPILDADGSHHPEQLPQLLAALDDADLVLGSRWVPGGRVEDWPRDRKSTRLNSSHANISYAVFCLKKNKEITYSHPSILHNSELTLQ